MRDPRRGPEKEDVAAAALLALPFAAAVGAMQILSPPSEAQWSRADPILGLAPRELTLAVIPFLALALAFGWWRLARPSRAAMMTSTRDGLLGALVTVSIAVALRLAVGPHLPAFIPSEESAGPGVLLGLGAGLSEELACRLLLLPLLYFALRKRRPRLAAPVAVVLTALFFALWHVAGEDAPNAAYFATRFVMPGCVMSVVWLASPSAIVCGHAAAHLAIPALFV